MSLIDFREHNAVDFKPHPEKTFQSFLHFSDSPVEGGVLHGARRGSSPESSDSDRISPVRTNPDGSVSPAGSGAPPAVHAYRSGHVGHPVITRRKFAHKVSGHYAIADLAQGNNTWNDTLNQAFAAAKAQGLDDRTAHGVAVNAAESALKNNGFDGYEHSSASPGSVVLFGDQPLDAR